jgi:hypothetical protein
MARAAKPYSEGHLDGCKWYNFLSYYVCVVCKLTLKAAHALYLTLKSIGSFCGSPAF